jgi:hypothetical protein
VVDGDLHERRRRHSELAHLVSMTDGSSSNSVLEEEAMTVSLSPSLDGDGSGSVVVGHGKQSGGRHWRAKQSSGTSELEGDGGMALFFVEVLTGQRVRVACRVARRVVATGGVRSPPRLHAQCHARTQPPQLVKRRGQLTSGPSPHFLISGIFNHPNFEIQIGYISAIQNSPNFASR